MAAKVKRWLAPALLALTAVAAVLVAAWPLDASPVREVAAALPSQASTVDVSLDIASPSLEVGATITVSVLAGPGVTGLFGAQIDLSFDPAVVEVTATNVGALLRGNGQVNAAGGILTPAPSTTLLGPAVCSIPC